MMGLRDRTAGWLIGALLLLAFPALADRTLVVYLPDAPVESSKKLAESVTDLQQLVSVRSGVRFDLKFFRKAEDCAAYLTANTGIVAIVVAPPEFLADTAPDLTPILQFSRDGKDTYHRIVIVKTSDAAKSLADLHGRSVSKIQTAGARAAELESRVLHGEGGFRTVVAPDDLAAAANVIYGGSDAALVSEHNPFAASHLGKDLRVIYTSPAIPLPVVAIRAQAFTDREREAVEQALVSAGGTLAALQVSRLERLPSGKTLVAMIGGSEMAPKPIEEKKLEIVAVPLDAIELPAPSTALLTCPAVVTVDIPVIPLPERP